VCVLQVFPWTLEEQGSVLGAFLWGYAFTQIPAGYLTTRFGAKLLFGMSIISSSVILLATPFIARQFGWIGVTVSRALAGLVQVCSFFELFHVRMDILEHLFIQLEYQPRPWMSI